MTSDFMNATLVKITLNELVRIDPIGMDGYILIYLGIGSNARQA